MFILNLSRSINRNLFRVFDQSRIGYMLVLFPAYQLLAFVGVAAIVLAFGAAGSEFYLALIGIILGIFIGVPILASWYLSCLLFCMGFFSFLAELGFPMMPWITRQIEGAVNWFKPAQ